jgi:hypothetical protein
LTDVPQSGVLSDEMMDKILDRSYLETKDDSCPLPASGVGYEMMAQQGITGGGLNHKGVGEGAAGAEGEGVGLLRNISGGEGGEDELAGLQREQKRLVDEEAAKKKAKEEERERQKKIKQAEKDTKKAAATEAPVEAMAKRTRRH